jgi:hypothetical protein
MHIHIHAFEQLKGCVGVFAARRTMGGEEREREREREREKGGETDRKGK